MSCGNDTFLCILVKLFSFQDRLLQDLGSFPCCIHLLFRESVTTQHDLQLIFGQIRNLLGRLLSDGAHVFRQDKFISIGCLIPGFRYIQSKGQIIVDGNDTVHLLFPVLLREMQHKVSVMPVQIAADKIDRLHGCHIVKDLRIVVGIRLRLPHGVILSSVTGIISVRTVHKGTCRRLSVDQYDHRLRIRDQSLLSEQLRNRSHSCISFVDIGTFLYSQPFLGRRGINASIIVDQLFLPEILIQSRQKIRLRYQLLHLFLREEFGKCLLEESAGIFCHIFFCFRPRCMRSGDTLCDGSIYIDICKAARHEFFAVGFFQCIKQFHHRRMFILHFLAQSFHRNIRVDIGRLGKETIHTAPGCIRYLNGDSG